MNNYRFTNPKDYGTHVSITKEKKFPWGKLLYPVLFAVLAILIIYRVGLDTGAAHKAANGKAVYITGYGFVINDELSDVEAYKALEDLIRIRQNE